MDKKAVPLSKRELSVAQHYARGETHKEIAAELQIAPATVRNHLAAIYRKLGVSNKPGLIRELSARARHGLVLPQTEPDAPTVSILDILDTNPAPFPVGASVAVMPFQIIGGSEMAHVSHGVTLAIHNNLTRFPDLIVSGHGSCFALSRQTSDASEIMNRLGVRYVVQGAVRMGEERLQISAELTDGVTGRVLWSERFDGLLNELVELESRAATAIAASLSLRIIYTEYERRSNLSPDQLTGYDWVLRGNCALEFGGKDNLADARRSFDYALAIDPRSAAASAGLSLVYGYECDQLLAEDYNESLEHHRRLAEKAVELDDSDSRTHYALVCAHLLGGQFELAELHAVRALELNPSEYHNICNRGYTCMSLGRLEDSLACFDQSLRRNPLAPNNCLLALGIIEYLNGNYAQAVTALSRITASHVQKPGSLAAAYAQLRYTDLAGAAAQECVRRARKLPSGPTSLDRSEWQMFWKRAYPYLNRDALNQMLNGLRKAGLTA